MSISTTPECKQLAMAIDRAIPTDEAGDLLHAFYLAVRSETQSAVASELAQLRARLNAVLDICDREQRNAMRWQDPIPVPEWVAKVQRAALGDGGAS